MRRLKRCIDTGVEEFDILFCGLMETEAMT